MTHTLNRRTVLRAGATAGVVAVSQLFPGIPALADFAAGPTLRRNASTMAESDPILRGYRRAITAMRALPDTNPCSWFYQAAIHGTNDPRNLTAWNTCHTDPTFFWAWHRMYLYWFERIVRKHSGMYDWAIPFWDWGNPAERALPAPFRNSGSVLFNSTRKPTINAGAELSTTLGTSIVNAMTLLNYFSTQSAVNGPHGSVHGAIGGNMGSVSTAATDPIFWAHHAQIDRLWNLWLAQGGGRSSPVEDSTWRNSTYTFFDECCQPVTMKGCDVLRAARQLSYAYEGEPSQVEQYCPRVLRPFPFNPAILARLRRPIVLARRPLRIPVPPVERELMRRKMLELETSREERAAVQIKGIEADTQPGVSWEVHVGRAGFTPGPDSLVGVFALFAAGLRDRRQHFHPAEFVFPIGKALRGISPDQLEVVFIPTSGLEQRNEIAETDLRTPVRVAEVNIVADRAPPPLAREEQETLRKEEAGR